MSGVDGASGAAKRRRERRQRSWLRHEQLSVKMALSAALHHSRGVGPELHEAPRGLKTDRAVEEEVREVNDALQGQKRPPPGMRPAPLPEVAGPQATVTVGYVAAGAPSLTVVLVSDDRIDDAALQFLLQQSLLARAEEEEKAREEAEVKELEDDLVLREQRLFRLVEQLHGAGLEIQAECSWLELAAVRWYMVKAKILKRKEKRKKGSCSPALHDVSRFSLPLVRHRPHAHASVARS